MADVFTVLRNVYFKEKNNGFFVECGSSEGTIGSCCLGLENLGWRGINIEAQNSYYSQLIHNRPKATNLNYALCDKDDCELTFTVTSQVGNSSLEHSEKHIQELIQLRKSSFQKQPVKGITWKKLMNDQKLQKVDVLCLDVEGCEKYVLSGMTGCEVLPDVICIEVGYDWGPKKEGLIQLGYRFDFFHDNNAYVSKPTQVFDQNAANGYRQQRFDWWDVTIYDANKDAF